MRKSRNDEAQVLRIPCDLQPRCRLADRHHFDAVNVEVGGKVGDPPHGLRDVFRRDRMRAAVDLVGRSPVAAGAQTFTLEGCPEGGGDAASILAIAPWLTALYVPFGYDGGTTLGP